MFDQRIIRLIAITDALRGDPEELARRSLQAIDGGVTCIQLRLKDMDTRTQVEIAKLMVCKLPVPVIVNDRVDIALASGAAGVHLGADDLPVSAARKIAPPGFIIGASVGCDEEIANSRGADYVGIGPVFPTSTKPDAGNAIGMVEFARLASAVGLPAVGVGGITADNAHLVMADGAEGIAAASSIFGADNSEKAARDILRGPRMPEA